MHIVRVQNICDKLTEFDAHVLITSRTVAALKSVKIVLQLVASVAEYRRMAPMLQLNLSSAGGAAAAGADYEMRADYTEAESIRFESSVMVCFLLLLLLTLRDTYCTELLIGIFLRSQVCTQVTTDK